MGLDTVELVFALENFFGLRVPDTEAEQMGTVQDIANGFCRLRGGCDEAPSEVRHRVQHRLSADLQALLRLPRRPAPSVPLADLREATAAQWRPLLTELAARTGWEFPAFTDPVVARLPPTSWLGRLFQRQPERWVDWRRATLADLVDWTVALNYQRFYHGPAISGRYDVLRAVIGIVAERSGVDVWEIRPQDSITDDLGMD